MKYYQKTGKVGESAAAAGVDRKTARKYLRGARSPDEPREPRHWRTRPDAFADVWPMVEEQLQREPSLMAKSLWEWLCKERPGEFVASQQRTFERRVSAWKRRQGGEPEVFFSQEHRPGERLELDWTDAKGLEVRIEGEEFKHYLVAVTLPYSNWQWARVCQSESFLSLKIGLQSAIWELGGVPGICQTDNSSTATHHLKRGQGDKAREYNARYLGLLMAMGMKPGLIAIGKPHQNGDVESGHGHLLRALKDALALRGSRDFESLAAYEEWLFQRLRERNASREPRVSEEKRALGPLPTERWPEYEEVEARVSRESIARVGKVGYSVPSRWAGRRLRARISERSIAFYDGAEEVARVERRQKSGGVYVDWRHVIGALKRKPGAMARWSYRDCLFPSQLWRRLYDGLLSKYSERRAEREYLLILELALEHGVERTQEALERLGIESADLDGTRRELRAQNKVVEVNFEPDLSVYDALVEAEEDDLDQEAFPDV